MPWLLLILQLKRTGSENQPVGIAIKWAMSSQTVVTCLFGAGGMVSLAAVQCVTLYATTTTAAKNYLPAAMSFFGITWNGSFDVVGTFQ